MFISGEGEGEREKERKKDRKEESKEEESKKMDMGENEPVESGRLSSFHVYFHLTRPIEAVVAFRGHPLSHFWYHLHLKR